MKFEIKNRFNGAVIFSVETTSWKLAVEAAIKSCADLRYADLRYADLRSADLRSANLRSANLSYADLSSADLSYAKGVSKYLCTPLLMLLDQPGNIIAYKLVKEDGLAPFNGGITYEVGKKYEVLTADKDEMNHCGEGINVATLDWCMKEHQKGYRILKAQFKAEDIAAIPTATDGKFRLFRCKIVGEVDLKKVGVTK